jgi:ATP-dependent helicase/nuclease subunit A
LTVHAAKGLESKIVLLPDTCRIKNAQHEPKLYSLAANPEPLLVWSPSSGTDPVPVSTLRETQRDREAEEYRRLFYVAMTRAEERLYIMGYHGTKQPEPDSWYFMAQRTLSELMQSVPSLWDQTEDVLRFTDGAPLIESDDDHVATSAEPAAPAWLLSAAPREAPVIAPIRPSSALDAADMDPQSEEARAFRAHALQAGRMTHELLQHLGGLPEVQRMGAAQRYIARRGMSLPEDLRARVLREVFDVLEEPTLAPLFSPGSRAEVSLGGDIVIQGKARPILGQIDRLAQSEGCVLIADFKTGKVAEGALPVAYAAQLALYRLALQQIDPTKQVRAFLVWTAGPRIDEITAEMAEAALAAL